MRKLFGDNILLFILLLLVVLLFYGNTLNTYFQQDEWDWLGRYTYYNSISKIPFWEAFKSSLFPHPRYRFTPLFDGIFAAQVYFFSLNFKPYVFISLLLHTLNAFFLFILVKKLTKDKSLAILSSFFFATSSIGQKAVTWVFTSINTQTAALFSIISLIYFLDFIENQSRKKFFISLSFLWIAIWFKETALTTIAIFPFLILIIKGYRKEFFKRTLIKLGGFTFFYFTLRSVFSIIGSKIHTEGYPDFGRFLEAPEYLNLIFWLPIRSIVDGFLFPSTLYSFSQYLVDTFSLTSLTKNSTQYGLYIENRGVDIATGVIFIFLGIFGFFFYKSLKKDSKKIFLVSVIFLLSVCLTHLFLSIRGTSALINILRSRDLYLGITGSSLMLALLVKTLISQKSKILKFLPLLLITIYSYYHYTNINTYVLTQEIDRAKIRQSILTNIYNLYPNIKENAVFYTKSDSKYYGHSIETMPFQTGFGRTLLVYYTLKNNSFPKEFMKDDFLYLPLSEGYKKLNNTSFGYYSNFDSLTKDKKTYQINPEQIYSFSYSGKTGEIEDISDEIRNRIKNQ